MRPPSELRDKMEQARRLAATESAVMAERDGAAAVYNTLVWVLGNETDPLALLI